ncbi:MAG: DUF86 domain-containing protein [Coriobacteriia bacterium]|nr:DUF86 domain-containing protein [Coriobacteriia bacterium]
MLPSERDEDQLRAIVRFAGKIQGYVERFGNCFESFDADEDYRDLCYYALVQIGEAVNALSEDFVSNHSHVPWAEIYGMRCYLVHGYDNVSDQVIWSAIERDIPKLRDFCKRIIE